MDTGEFEYIIARIIDNANSALIDAAENSDDDFYKGRKFAYYEVLDTIKNEFAVRGQNLKEYGLDCDLDRRFL